MVSDCMFIKNSQCGSNEETILSCHLKASNFKIWKGKPETIKMETCFITSTKKKSTGNYIDVFRKNMSESMKIFRKGYSHKRELL